MSKSKNILLQLTGSIACYKAAYLISQLVKAGHEVQCIATNSALEFIGNATLEGLTRKTTLNGVFEKNHHLAHIDLIKWADVLILYPASANTVNSLAAGLAPDLIGSLFLANNFKKPYWIAPAMNVNMYEHPATKSSLKKLEDWGAFIFDTEEGILACGDSGKGKLIDPVFVYDKVQREIAK